MKRKIRETNFSQMVALTHTLNLNLSLSLIELGLVTILRKENQFERHYNHLHYFHLLPHNIGGLDQCF